MCALLVLVAALGLGTPSAYGATDFSCVSDCTMQGTQYGLCMKRCSYGSQPQPEQPKPRSTDFFCVQRCTDSGNQYGLCVERCSY